MLSNVERERFSYWGLDACLKLSVFSSLSGFCPGMSDFRMSGLRLLVVGGVATLRDLARKSGARVEHITINLGVLDEDAMLVVKKERGTKRV